MYVSLVTFLISSWYPNHCHTNDLKSVGAFNANFGNESVLTAAGWSLVIQLPMIEMFDSQISQDLAYIPVKRTRR